MDFYQRRRIYVGKIKKSNKTYTLSEREFNYLKILNLALQFSTLKDKAISGFLYYVCNSRFGFKEDQNLIFEIDLEDDKKQLHVKEIPTEAIEQELANHRPKPQ